MIRIALSQRAMSEVIDENISAAIKDIEQAALNRAELIFFPEIQLSPFFPQYPARDVSQYSMTLEDKFISDIQHLCAKYNIVSSPNFYLKEKGKHYDASAVIDADGALLGISKMVYIMQADKFYEQDYYAPSDTGFKVYDTKVGKVGVVICFDRHMPESIRSCAEQGADLIIIPTANTVGEPLDIFEWELRVAAYRNGVFIAMCNRVGLEGEMDFVGESLVVSPKGELIVKAGNQSEIVYVDIDLNESNQQRKKMPSIKSILDEIEE